MFVISVTFLSLLKVLGDKYTMYTYIRVTFY